jgi:hypothetical protein
MTIRQTTLAAALALASMGPAHAEGLKPLQGQVIDLGDASRSPTTLSSATAFVSSPPSRKRVRTPCPCGSWPCSAPTKA